jgi:hypothetical protein
LLFYDKDLHRGRYNAGHGGNGIVVVVWLKSYLSRLSQPFSPLRVVGPPLIQRGPIIAPRRGPLAFSQLMGGPACVNAIPLLRCGIALEASSKPIRYGRASIILSTAVELAFSTSSLQRLHDLFIPTQMPQHGSTRFHRRRT